MPGEEAITLNELMNRADSALLQVPQNPDMLAYYHETIERVNTSEFVSTCVTCPEGIAAITSYEFLVNGSSTFSDLRGNINYGNNVRATFRIGEGCEDVELSLVSYEASSYEFNPATASKQVAYDQQTGFFDAGGEYILEVDVPSCFFEIDFVKGPVIDQLELDGSDNFYSAQNRLISSDNGDEDASECGLDNMQVSSLEAEVSLGELGGDDDDLLKSEVLKGFSLLSGGGDVLASTTATSTPENPEGNATSTDPGNSTSTPSLVLEDLLVNSTSTPNSTSTIEQEEGGAKI